MNIFIPLEEQSGRYQEETAFISSCLQAIQAVFFMLAAFFEGSLAESGNFRKVISNNMWQGASSCVSRKHPK